MKLYGIFLWVMVFNFAYSVALLAQTSEVLILECLPDEYDQVTKAATTKQGVYLGAPQLVLSNIESLHIIFSMDKNNQQSLKAKFKYDLQDISSSDYYYLAPNINSIAHDSPAFELSMDTYPNSTTKKRADIYFYRPHEDNLIPTTFSVRAPLYISAIYYPPSEAYPHDASVTIKFFKSGDEKKDSNPIAELIFHGCTYI